MPCHKKNITDEKNNGILEEFCRQHKISKREREIAGLILQGLSNQEINDRLFISPHTVKNHIYNLFRKANVNSRTQFIRVVMKSDKDY